MEQSTNTYFVTLQDKYKRTEYFEVRADCDSDAVGEAFIQIQRRGGNIYDWKCTELEKKDVHS